MARIIASFIALTRGGEVTARHRARGGGGYTAKQTTEDTEYTESVLSSSLLLCVKTLSLHALHGHLIPISNSNSELHLFFSRLGASPRDRQ